MLIIKKTNAKYITMFLAANISSTSWVILCVFTFWVPCCDVRFDFRIKTMFGSSLPLVVCRRPGFMFYLRYLCFFAHSGIQHVLCYILFCFSSSMLQVSLDYPFLNAPSVSIMFMKSLWKSPQRSHFLMLQDILTWPPSFALLTNERVIHSV
jgi:hypothetical protein